MHISGAVRREHIPFQLPRHQSNRESIVICEREWNENILRVMHSNTVSWTWTFPHSSGRSAFESETEREKFQEKTACAAYILTQRALRIYCVFTRLAHSRLGINARIPTTKTKEHRLGKLNTFLGETYAIINWTISSKYEIDLITFIDFIAWFQS